MVRSLTGPEYRRHTWTPPSRTTRPTSKTRPGSPARSTSRPCTWRTIMTTCMCASLSTRRGTPSLRMETFLSTPTTIRRVDIPPPAWSVQRCSFKAGTVTRKRTALSTTARPSTGWIGPQLHPARRWTLSFGFRAEPSTMQTTCRSLLATPLPFCWRRRTPNLRPWKRPRTPRASPTHSRPRRRERRAICPWSR